MGSGVLFAIEVGATVAAAGEQAEATSRQEKALDEQSKNTQLQYLQKSNSRLSQLTTILGQQEAIETTKGVSLGSASFNAIQRQTFNISQKRQTNLNLEEKANQAAIASKKQNLESSLFASLFGDVAGAASAGSAIKSNTPAKSKGGGL